MALGLAPLAVFLAMINVTAGLALATCGVVVLAFLARRLVGGFTGDILGGVQQVAEVGLLLGFALKGRRRMTLIICPLHAVGDEIERSRPARLISLLAPHQDAPDAPPGVQRLTLKFHDISRRSPGFIPPDRAMVAGILAFGAAWAEPAPLLIHCWMGISRSTAAALILACAADPSRTELDIAQALRKASPTATPNPLIVVLADELLDRDGRLCGRGGGDRPWCGGRPRLTFSACYQKREPRVLTPARTIATPLLDHFGRCPLRGIPLGNERNERQSSVPLGGCRVRFGLVTRC